MKDKTLIYGTHAVLSAIKTKNRKIHEILATNTTKSKLPAEVAEITRLSTDYEISKILERRGKEINHQGLLAFCSGILPKTLKDMDLAKPLSIVVLLDSLTDITNIGTIVRSCAAFGVDFIVYHKKNMPDIANNEVVIKNSCGGIESVSVVAESNLANAIAALKKHNYWIIGFDLSGKETLRTFTKKNSDIKKFAIILGSESNGIRELTAKLCDFLVKIEISQNMESLNVASAAAIALYELSLCN